MKTIASRIAITLAASFAVSTLSITYVHAAAGDLDASFFTGGIVSFSVLSFPNLGMNFDSAQAVAIQADGKIVVAGYGYVGPAQGFGLARFNSDGSPDLTFGVGGKVVTIFPEHGAFADAVLIQPDGKIVAA